MPKAKRTSSRKRKYSYRRKRGWGGNSKYVRSSRKSPLGYLRSLPVGGVRKVSLKKLRHCQEVTIDPVTGGMQKIEFYPTRPAQLTIASGGSAESPNNFEAVSREKYRKCVVVAAKLTFRYYPSSSQTTDFNSAGGYIGWYTSNASDVTLIDDMYNAGGVATIMEQPRSVIMKGLPYTNTQQKDCVVMTTINPAKFWGVDQKNYEDEDNYATEWDATNEEWMSPDDNICAQLFVASASGNNPGRIRGVVTIDLVIKCTQPHYTGP